MSEKQTHAPDKNTDVEKVRDKLRETVKDSGLTYQQLGERMGYQGDAAKTLISRLLNTERDPRLSTLIRLSKALNISLYQLLMIDNR